MGMKLPDGTWKSCCLDKLKPGEPFFVLRAQDLLAPILVDQWAAMAKAGGTPQAKVDEARATADAMAGWPERKHPD